MFSFSVTFHFISICFSVFISRRDFLEQLLQLLGLSGKRYQFNFIIIILIIANSATHAETTTPLFFYSSANIVSCSVNSTVGSCRRRIEHEPIEWIFTKVSMFLRSNISFKCDKYKSASCQKSTSRPLDSSNWFNSASIRNHSTMNSLGRVWEHFWLFEILFWMLNIPSKLSFPTARMKKYVFRKFRECLQSLVQWIFYTSVIRNKIPGTWITETYFVLCSKFSFPACVFWTFLFNF